MYLFSWLTFLTFLHIRYNVWRDSNIYASNTYKMIIEMKKKTVRKKGKCRLLVYVQFVPSAIKMRKGNENKGVRYLIRIQTGCATVTFYTFFIIVFLLSIFRGLKSSSFISKITLFIYFLSEIRFQSVNAYRSLSFSSLSTDIRSVSLDG